jgi:hypothetical protein
MARRMVVVPEEFLKVFKQEPQIPLNILRNDDLLADRLNKALHQRTLNETKTASTQTQSSDHIVDQKPTLGTSTVINQPGINETLATPTVAFPQRAPEQQSTPAEFHSTVSEATPPERSLLKQRQEILKRKLRTAKAWDLKTKEVYNWEGSLIEHSNIDQILSYAFDPEGGEPPLGYEAIARHLKIMKESGFPNKKFQEAVDESSGHSPVTVRRKTRSLYVTQRGKGRCCRGRGGKPLRWTLY